MAVEESSSQAAADFTQPPSPWLRAGPVLVALLIGLKLTFSSWLMWGQRAPESLRTWPAHSDGSSLVSPDRDMPVYVAGLLLSLTLAIRVGTLWNRCLARSRSDAQWRWLRLLSYSHVPVAATLALSPSRSFNLAAACAALLFVAAALWTASRPAVWPLRRLRARPPRPSAFRTAAPPTQQSQPSARMRSVLWQVIALALIIAIVYVPYPSQIVAMAYRLDHFYHIDFYAMAPALAFRHGVALGTDFYSQYGVGWPVLLGALSRVFAPLSYALWVSICVVWGCIYYAMLHTFLRLVVRSAAWATAGLLLAILLQLVSGTDGLPKWLWPSSTVMRYAMDVFLFTGCLIHARSGKAWLGLPIGIVAAVAVLLGIDTGLYLLLCLGLYLFAATRLQQRPRHLGRFAALASASFVCVFLAVMALASRGTLLRPEFWSGWSESLRVYGQGISHLPIADTLREGRIAGVLLIVMLTTYLSAVYRMLQQGARRRLTPEHLVIGLVAVNGLATLLLFIGRSHPYNLTHVSIPFCIVLTSFAAELTDQAKAGAESGRPATRIVLGALPLACVLGALAAIIIHPGLRIYPSLIAQAQHRLQGRQAAHLDQVFAVTSRAVRRPTAIASKWRASEGSVRFCVSCPTGATTASASLTASIRPISSKPICDPHFRYSPVLTNLMYKAHLETIIQQLIDDPPDYLLLPAAAPITPTGQPTTDTFESIVKVVERLYVSERRVADKVVYRRNAASPAEGPASGAAR